MASVNNPATAYDEAMDVLTRHPYSAHFFGGELVKGLCAMIEKLERENSELNVIIENLEDS